jgi:hypothetical protein
LTPLRFLDRVTARQLFFVLLWLAVAVAGVALYFL